MAYNPTVDVSTVNKINRETVNVKESQMKCLMTAALTSQRRCRGACTTGRSIGEMSVCIYHRYCSVILIKVIDVCVRERHIQEFAQSKQIAIVIFYVARVEL